MPLSRSSTVYVFEYLKRLWTAPLARAVFLLQDLQAGCKVRELMPVAHGIKSMPPSKPPTWTFHQDHQVINLRLVGPCLPCAYESSRWSQVLTSGRACKDAMECLALFQRPSCELSPGAPPRGRRALRSPTSWERRTTPIDVAESWVCDTNSCYSCDQKSPRILISLICSNGQEELPQSIHRQFKKVSRFAWTQFESCS